MMWWLWRDVKETQPRAMIFQHCVIQTSIVEYLTPGNTGKEHQGQDPLMNRRLLEERKFQDDSPRREKEQ